jgi:hypothetical protein
VRVNHFCAYRRWRLRRRCARRRSTTPALR